MKKPVVWIGAALVIALSFGWWFLSQQRKEFTDQEVPAPHGATLPPDVVEVSLERQRKLELTVRPVALASVRSSLRLTGEITSVPGAQVVVTSPVSGRIVGDSRIRALTVGSRVEKEQALMVVESFSTGSAGLTAQGQLGQEEAFYAKAQADWERAQELYKAGLIPRRDLQQAEADVRAAEGRLEALRKQVELYRQLQLSGAEEKEPGRFWLRAPIGGVISEWKIARGQTVAADEPLATLTNISTVIAEANLFVDDLNRAKVGEPATCTSEAYPGESFRGVVSYIGPHTESGTRVVPVHIDLPNPEGKLRIGIPVEVRIETGPARQALVVPREAVIFEEGLQVVYVQVAPDRFERRVVRLGETAETGLEIRDGLKPGEKLVVRGAFLLKAEALKGAFPPAEAGEEQEKRERERR